MKHSLLAVLLWSFVAPAIVAQPQSPDTSNAPTAENGPRLLADLRPAQENVSPRPGPVLYMDSDLPADELPVLFRLESADLGHELWRSDGRPGGARPVADILPGWGDGVAPSSETGRRGVRLGDRLLVSIDGPNPGLWAVPHASGTPADQPVRLTPPQAGVWELPDFTLGDSVIFSAYLPEGGVEPWITDGTAEGTRMLVDLVPGVQGSHPSQFAWYRGQALFYSASRLWRTDGTPSGTRPVDLGPDFDALFFTFQVVGDRLVLNDDDTFWGMDGLASTPVQLASFCADNDPDCRTLLPLVHGDRMWFQFENQLWSTDGTPQGTGLRYEPDGPLSSKMAPLGDDLLLWVDSDVGWQALRFDGTTAHPIGTFYAHWLVRSVGERAVFLAKATSTHDYQLWSTDGTPAGTSLIADVPTFEPTFVQRGPEVFMFLADRLADTSLRFELWSSDGTAAGTRRLEVFRPSSSNESSNPLNLTTASDGRVVFSNHAESGRIQAFYTTDGTTDGTRLLSEGFRGRPQALGDGLVFLTGRYDLTIPLRPWLTDGVVPPVLLGPPDPTSGPRLPVLFGDRVVYAADQGLGIKLWTSDGTLDGTELVTDIDPTWNNAAIPCSPCPRDLYELPKHLEVLGDQLIFDAHHPDVGTELWVSDGTPEGTRLLADLAPGQSSSGPRHLQVAGGRVYFLVTGYVLPDTASPGFLWSTDGTAAGTRPVPGMPEMTIVESIAFGSRWAAFVRTGERYGQPGAYALWTADGTSGQRIAEFRFEPSQLHAVGDRMVFTVDTPALGEEVWTTDGTPEGTRPLVDLWPGPFGSAPTLLAVSPAGDRLVFAAAQETVGMEAWITDGTAEGTALLADIVPGPGSSSPTGAAFLGDDVVLAANDGVHGAEPWIVPATDLAGGLCASTETAHCLGGRFLVQAHWRVTRDDPARATRSGTARTLPGTADTANFWFFGQTNVELAVKVLDGTPLNDHHWLYYGALSDVEYWIEATDLLTGTTRVYHNPQGNLCGRGDVLAFPAPAFPAPPLGRAPGDAAATITPATASKAGACDDVPDALCLHDRFAVTVEWTTDHGSVRQGSGHPIPFSDDSGYFWFFGASNIELIVKVLDGRTVNDRWWVYYGALSDVGYTIRIVDTVTGAERTYENPQGNLCGGADVEAFE